MRTWQVRSLSRGEVAVIAFACGVALSPVAGSVFNGIRTLSRDDCVTVTTQFGEGRSQSAETCS